MDQCDTSAVDDTADVGLAKNRSRREKKDRYGRKAAFEQFREARSGHRPRYVISEERNIYEEVDEEEYSKIVRDRQDDDWIVDDGTGYVEDGREIFDEEPGEVVSSGKRKTAANAKAAKNPNIRPTDSKPKSIRGMFAAAATKPKVQKTVSLEDDAILGDIMGELKKGDIQTIRPAAVKMLRQTEPECLSPKINKAECNGFPQRLHTGRVAAEKTKYDSHSGSSSRVLCDNSNFSNKPAVRSSENSHFMRATNIRKEKSSNQSKNDTSVLPASQQIQEFASQEIFQSDCQSQVIEDFDNEMDTSAVCSEVDVSGIDFNDNFELGIAANPCVFD